jgi:hypothetical protein
MTNNRILLFVNILIGLLILLLLVTGAGINRSLQSEISLLHFGTDTLFLAAGSSLLSIASGGLLALTLPFNKPDDGQNREWGLVSGSLLAVPVLLLLYQLLLAFYGPAPILIQFWGQYRFSVLDWLLFSQAIPIWLGVVIGWLVKVAFLSRK